MRRAKQKAATKQRLSQENKKLRRTLRGKRAVSKKSMELWASLPTEQWSDARKKYLTQETI